MWWCLCRRSGYAAISGQRRSNALANPFLTSAGIFPLAQLNAENLGFISSSFGVSLDFCGNIFEESLPCC